MHYLIQIHLSGMWLPIIFYWLSWWKYFLVLSSSQSVIDQADTSMIKCLKNSSCKDKLKRLDIFGENISSDIECLSKRIIAQRILTWQFPYHVTTKQVRMILIERILSEMGTQRWIYQEAKEACPSGPFILHGPLPRSQRIP